MDESEELALLRGLVAKTFSRSERLEYYLNESTADFDGSVDITYAEWLYLATDEDFAASAWASAIG